MKDGAPLLLLDPAEKRSHLGEVLWVPLADSWPFRDNAIAQEHGFPLRDDLQGNAKELIRCSIGG